MLLLHYLITPFLLYGPLWTHFHLLKSLHIYQEKNVRHTHRYSVLSYKYIRDIQMSLQPSNAASLAPATETHCDLLEVHQPESGKVSRTGASLSSR